jgi:hypothetical protein
MINFKKAYIFRIVYVFISIVFFIDSIVYSMNLPSRSYLRVPLQDTSRFKQVLAQVTAQNNDNFDSLSTDQLIREAEKAMPFCGDRHPDWARFNEIIRALKTRDGVKILIYAGPKFNNKGKIDIDIKIVNINVLWKLYNYVINKEGFLYHTLMNIHQHVKPGIALVVEREITTMKGNKYKEISVIDNGAGPIDKKTKENIPVEELPQFYKKRGVGGRSGFGLASAARCCADFSRLDGRNSVIIEGSEEMPRGKIPGKDYMPPPKIIWQNNKGKLYGFTITGYFLQEGSNREDVRSDIIRRAEEEPSFYQIDQSLVFTKARISL